MRALPPPDWVIIGYQFVVAAISCFAGADARRFVALNLGVLAFPLGFAWLEARRPGRVTKFLHAWYIVLIVPICFKMLGPIIARVHPYADGRWDRLLAQWDAGLFGDVPSFFRDIAWAPLADVLTLCYWSYFFLPIILGIVLYDANDLRRFRQTTTVLLIAWFLSYLGYFAVPAIGPHWFEGERAAGLAGWVWAGAMHQNLLRLEGAVPDAFPSGHALVAITVATLAFRFHRRAFAVIAPLATGLVAATMYLRYHYVVDVLAALPLVPLSLWAGRAFYARITRSSERPATE